MNFIRFILALTTAAAIGCANDSLNILEGAGDLHRPGSIINGDPAVGHPAVVGLHQLTKRGGGSVYIKPFCSGTLIDPTTVLTAAHCLDDARQLATAFKEIGPNDVAVFFGDEPTSANILANLYDVSEVSIYPGYDRTKFEGSNDIGLLRLSDPAPVAPAAPMTPAQGPFVVGEDLNIVGFGESVEYGGSTWGVKLEATVALSAVLGPVNIEHQVNSNGQIICSGDSGGPAFIDRGGVAYVAGVASYVTASQTQPLCAHTGVHTRIDAFDGYLKDFNPTCGDARCNGDENCETCAGDCGACYCGDGACTSGETCTSCETDCGTCGGGGGNCSPAGASCSSDGECCSNKCRGPSGGKSCR